jgi:hypothetical protein
MAAQGYSLRNSDFMFVNTATGEKIPLKSEEEKTIGKNFPNLSFMLDGWYRIYNSMTNEIVRDKIFALYENTLSAIIAEDEGVSFAVPHTIFEELMGAIFLLLRLSKSRLGGCSLVKTKNHIVSFV